MKNNLHKISTLSNGVKIVTRTMDDTESVTVAFFVGAGGRYEDMKTEYGAAHFLEHLLFKGTTKRPEAKIIAEEVDSVGGYMNAYTAEDHTAYYIKLPKNYAGLAFNILADILTDPLFNPDEVERERGVILEEMNVYKDDPGRYVFDLTGDLLWPKDTLRTNVIGTPEIISKMPRQVIMDYFKSLYTMDNLVISVAGNISHARAVELAEELLGGFATKARRGFEKVKGGESNKIANVIAQDTNQTHMIVAGRAPEIDAKDEPSFKILSTMLGSGMSSRLFLNVRERKALAYTIFMSFNNFVDSGKFEIYAGVNNDRVDEAVGAIKEELIRIRKEGIEKKELDKAKEQVRGRMIMGMESNSAVADVMGSDLIVSGKVWTLEEMLAEVDSVNLEGVIESAHKYLQPENLHFAGIGPIDNDKIKNIEDILRK
jgi:predicted Zn-dependent peptidase